MQARGNKIHWTHSIQIGMHKTKSNYGLKSKQEVLKTSKQRNIKWRCPKWFSWVNIGLLNDDDEVKRELEREP